MTNWLVRTFVKDPENTQSPAVRYAYGRMAGCTGLGCNLLLFLIKLLAGLLSGSLAIVADAFNNLSDAGSTVVTLVGFKLSGRPADEEHPFGHGRIEYLSAMGVAVLIILAGFELAKSAVEKILHPEPAEISLLTVAILVAAIAVKLWMAVFNKTIGTRIHSEALTASGIDSRNDVICTGVVLIASLVGLWTGVPLDGYVGLAVALFVIWSGFSVIREAISPLLGQTPDPELVTNIEETVLGFDGIVGVHDMLVHDYGPGRIFVSLHAEVPAEQDIRVSHDIVDNVEVELLRRFNIISCIHMDPVEEGNEETEGYRRLSEEVLASVDSDLTLHDFRVVMGESHTNLIFDVVIPHRLAKKAEEREAVAERIRQGIHEADDRLYAVIKLETRYT